mmetsp:Transcript_16156/g.40864  ORF Transcript_16156/g.40864 Transcript_16156/m.40864 type:complete len:92 (-) Transcript_16156:1005-1280(-)
MGWSVGPLRYRRANRQSRTNVNHAIMHTHIFIHIVMHVHIYCRHKNWEKMKNSAEKKKGRSGGIIDSEQRSGRRKCEKGEMKKKERKGEKR